MKVEIRADCIHLEGYVNAVGRDSRPIPSPHGRFIECVEPKTFAKSLKRRPNVELRFNHRADRILGSTKSGELELREDNIGLYAKCDVTDAEVREKAERGELRGWSFSFYKNIDKWEDAGDIQRRHLEDIDLTEVSILDKNPAYIATSIEQRGGEDNPVEIRSIDDEADVTDLSQKEKDPPSGKKEERDLMSRQRQTVEFLKMKGGFYNEK